MNGRENLMRVLFGGEPAWVPCTINANQWLAHHRKFKTLPAELEGCEDGIELNRRLGCDYFLRTPAGISRVYEDHQPVERTERGRLGERHIREVATPLGVLRSVSEDQEQFTSNYQVEDMVKDWATDGAALMWHLERTRYVWDEQKFEQVDARVGAMGLPLVSVATTPLKFLHQVFGLDHACVFVMDQPEAAERVCQAYWKGLWPVFEQIARNDRLVAVCMEDNVDTPFYPPGIIDRYWVPYVREAADLLAANGQRLFVHACGKLHALKQAFKDSHVHGLNGMAHGPLGDWTIADAREMGDHFVYDGGFSAHEQVTQNDVQVERFYEAFFAELDGWPRFVFAAACQTAITTPWQRIRKVVEICRRYSPPDLYAGT